MTCANKVTKYLVWTKSFHSRRAGYYADVWCLAAKCKYLEWNLGVLMRDNTGETLELTQKAWDSFMKIPVMAVLHKAYFGKQLSGNYT